MKFNFQSLDYFSGTKIPVIFLLDVSGSMGTIDKTGVSCINQLNSGFEVFLNNILEDEIASAALDLSVITFGGENPELFLDFEQWNGGTKSNFVASGGTPMGSALELAYQQIESRKLVYKDYGINYYQPWVILMTDGEPTDDIETAKSIFIDLQNKRKVTLFPVAIGNDANIEVLKELNPSINPLRVEGTDFKKFFTWLSRSVEQNELDIEKYNY
ncbi:MAG: vWA domain-containing protein [Cetobacterium sp.]|uniref:vWA domain-containing protein n=1 Tax=uncultured Cetobacterium sp. TaxID=527638 RepID=UPI0025DC55D9|nr:VWA domain-containing protein [uncultured Cetobacterium sp.]